MSTDKRILDLSFSLLGLLFLWPILLVIALVIKLEDGGPVFFRQERVGYRGRAFRIWKFRTMVPNAEKLGRQITIERDPRITAMGHWLRRLKLDELPQLFNVLTGEMSFVGPRPEVKKYVALYTAEQRSVLDLVPGITDMASIRYRNESEILARALDPDDAYVGEIMPEKIRINLAYAAGASVWRDLGVIVKTFFSLFEHAV
jgi:lipopolysaccharide/colanic/teichoic acid biosynthesis glycosyltransferase